MGIKILVKMTLKALIAAIFKHLYNKYIRPIFTTISNFGRRIVNFMFELLASLTFSDIEYVEDSNGKTKTKLVFNPIKLIENTCEMAACAAAGYIVGGN